MEAEVEVELEEEVEVEEEVEEEEEESKPEISSVCLNCEIHASRPTRGPVLATGNPAANLGFFSETFDHGPSEIEFRKSQKWIRLVSLVLIQRNDCSFILELQF